MVSKIYQVAFPGSRPWNQDLYESDLLESFPGRKIDIEMEKWDHVWKEIQQGCNIKQGTREVTLA